MNDEEMIKKIAESAQAFSEPIDFEKLVSDGILTQRGKSYYVTDLKALPAVVSKRIKTVTKTKYGIKVTFYRESKSLKKIANKFKGYLE